MGKFVNVLNDQCLGTKKRIEHRHCCSRVLRRALAGIENNYWRNRRFFCKMSPDEMVAIGAYMAEKASPILKNL
jgi:hypothetical protein